jgi:hypothetical protein
MPRPPRNLRRPGVHYFRLFEGNPIVICDCFRKRRRGGDSVQYECGFCVIGSRIFPEAWVSDLA